MISRSARKFLLAAAAIVMLLGVGAFTADAANAGPYPPAEISRTLFINPFDYTAGPAWLPYSKPRTIYLTAGTYTWYENVVPTWGAPGAFSAGRSIYLASNWYYWRCWMQTELLTDINPQVTGVASYCSLAPTDGSTPTAYFYEDPHNNAYAFQLDGAGDYQWSSTLIWESNP